MNENDATSNIFQYKMNGYFSAFLPADKFNFNDSFECDIFPDKKVMMCC